MKKIVQLVAALTIISAICAAVLALVNSKTKDRIASLTAEKTANAAKAVLPSDVKDTDWFAPQAVWALEKGLLSSGGAFYPDGKASRAIYVTLLYRLYK